MRGEVPEISIWCPRSPEVGRMINACLRPTAEERGDGLEHLREAISQLVAPKLTLVGLHVGRAAQHLPSFRLHLLDKR